MIDTATLPYIDLGAPAEVLRQYALEHLGRKISPVAKDETVVDRFATIYEEETGIRLQPVEPMIDDDEEDEEKPAGEKKPAVPKPIAATIIVQDDEKDPGAICGSVNFRAYRIKRNIEVRVSMAILESLKNAKKTVYDPKTMVSKEVLAYPFSVVALHFPGE